MAAEGPFGSSVERLRREGLLVQDLLGVLLGLRPMCRFPLAAAGGAGGRRLARSLRVVGLKTRVYESSYESPGVPLLCVGRDARRLRAFEEAAEAKSRARSLNESAALSERMGELLGYPDCCAAGFAEAERASARRGSPVGYPRLALERSGRAPYPFQSNFLYLFHSRSSRGELARMLRGGYRGMDLYLVPWIPCRFDCRASAKYGAKLYQALRELDPVFVEQVRTYLRATMLFYDDWRFVALQGSVRRYRGVLDVRTLFPGRDLELLRRGSALRRGSGGRLSVYEGRERLGTLSRRASLIEFR